jgi:GGDEF domain-containing protein
MAVLAQLDAETQRVSLAASRKARENHVVARFWMYLLSGAALLAGLFVAAAVLYYTNRVNREREQLATQDTLTGLPNRMLFMDRLEQSLIRAKRHDTLVGVMFIDLDNFKRRYPRIRQRRPAHCEVANRLQAVTRAEARGTAGWRRIRRDHRCLQDQPDSSGRGKNPRRGERTLPGYRARNFLQLQYRRQRLPE